MLFMILKFVHVASGLLAIAAGVTVLFGILTGGLREKSAVIFLEGTLAVSATGLLFPFHTALPTHWSAMLAVYLCGVAILSWRRFHLVDGWELTFVLSIICVLCLIILVVVMHSFEYLVALGMLSPPEARLPFLIAGGIVILLFAGIGIFTVRRYRTKLTGSLANQE
jgi:hypothetical protein